MFKTLTTFTFAVSALILTPTVANANHLDNLPDKETFQTNAVSLAYTISKKDVTGPVVAPKVKLPDEEEQVIIVVPNPVVEEVISDEAEVVSVATNESQDSSGSENSSVESTPAPEPAPQPKPQPKHEPAPSGAGTSIVDTAKKYIGTPYVSGGKSPSGFDCSGFTSYVYAQHGINIPSSSAAQRNAGTVVSNPQPGDIIWTPGHVGIYVGNGQQIDAPRPGKTIQVRGIWQSNPIYIRVG